VFASTGAASGSLLIVLAALRRIRPVLTNIDASESITLALTWVGRLVFATALAILDVGKGMKLLYSKVVHISFSVTSCRERF